MGAVCKREKFSNPQSPLTIFDPDAGLERRFNYWLDKTGSKVAAAIMATSATGMPTIVHALGHDAPHEGPFTVEQVAKRLRTSPDTVRGWIKSGQLKAANLATGPRPRYIVDRDDVAAFLKGRQPTAEPVRQRKRKPESSDRY